MATGGGIATAKSLKNRLDLNDELEEILPKRGDSNAKTKVGSEDQIDQKAQISVDDNVERSESDISFHQHCLTKHRFIGENTRNLLSLNLYFRDHSAESLARKLNNDDDALEQIHKLSAGIENSEHESSGSTLKKQIRRKLFGNSKKAEYKSMKSKYYEKLFKDHTKAILKDINTCTMNQGGGEYKERFFTLHGMLQNTIENKLVFTYISQNLLVSKTFKEDHDALIEEKSLFYGSKEGEHIIEAFDICSAEGKIPVISFATYEGKVKLLPLSQGVFQTQTYQFTHAIFALAFDKRRKYLTCGGKSNEIHVLELIDASGGTNVEMKLAFNLIARCDVIYALSYRYSDDLLAYCCSRGAVAIHAGLKSMDPNAHIEEEEGSQKVSSIAADAVTYNLTFSKNGEYLLTNTPDGFIFLFKVKSDSFHLFRYYKFKDDCTFSRTAFLDEKNCDLILLGTKDSPSIKILDIKDKKVIIDKEMHSNVFSLGSSGTSKIFAGFDDKNMKIFKVETSASDLDEILETKYADSKILEMWGSQYNGVGMCFAFDSDYFLTFHDNLTASIWNSKNDNEDIKINDLPIDDFNSIKFPCFSAGANTFAFALFPTICVYRKKNPNNLEKNSQVEYDRLEVDFSKLNRNVMNIGLIHMHSDNVIVIFDGTHKEIVFIEVPEKGGNASSITSLRAKGVIRTFASHGDLIAFGSSNDKVYIYSVNSPEFFCPEKTVKKKITLNPHCSDVKCLAFSRHNGRIASGSEDETIKVSHIAKGGLIRTFKPGSGVPTHLAFDNNDEHLAASFVMNRSNESVYKIHIFKIETGEIIFNLIRNSHPFEIAGFSSDGKFVTNSLVGQMITFNLKNQPIVISKDLIYSVAFSPDGKQYAYGGRSDSLVIAPTKHIWQTNLKEKSQKEMKNPDVIKISTNETINKVKFSNNSKWIAAACEGGVFYLTSLINGKNKEIELKDGLTIYALSFSHDDQYLLIGLESGFINIFHISLNESPEKMAISIANEKVHLKDIGAVAFSPIHDETCDRFLTGGHDGKVKLIKFFEKKSYEQDDRVDLEIEMVYKGHRGQVNTVSWSPDTKRLLSGGFDMKIIIYDRFTGAQILILEGFKGSIWSAAFIKGGQYILSGGEDRIIRVSDSNTGVEFLRREIPKGSDIWSVVIAPHDNDLVLAANDSGLYAFVPFFNTTDRLARMAGILSDQEIPIKLPDDTSILPFPLDMTRLQYSIARSNIKYVVDLTRILKTTKFSDPKMSSIFSLLYKRDTMEPFNKSNANEVIPYSKKTVPFDAWDYSEFYSGSKRNRFQRKMVRIHLLMPRKLKNLLHSVQNKQKILNLVIKYFPEKLSAIFDSFFTVPIYVSVAEDYYNSERFMMLPPYPSFKTIEDELTKKVLYFPKLNKVHPSTPSKNVVTQAPFSPLAVEAKENSSNRKVQAVIELSKNLKESSEFQELDDKANELNLKEKNERKKSKGENEVELKMTVFQIEEKEIIGLFQRFSEVEVSDALFKSENFSNLLEFYWKKYYQIHFFRRLLIYLAFLIIVCYNILKIYTDRQNFIAPTTVLKIEDFYMNLIIIAYLIIYFCGEFYEIISIKNDSENTTYPFSTRLRIYFSSPWNWIDLLMIITGLTSSVIDIAIGTSKNRQDDTYNNLIKALYSVFLFFCWMRLLDFARGFKVTSFLIRLIYKVTKDMLGFMGVLFYMLLGFVFLSYILQKSYSDHTLWEFFRIFYYVLLGDYGDFKGIQPNNSVNLDVSFFIIVGCTIIMVILMLNMLIALISESHGDVMKEEKQAERYEKLHIIIDSVRMLGWVRCLKRFRTSKNEDSLKYFCVLSQWESKAEEGELSKKLDEIKLSLSHFRQDQNRLNEEINKLFKEEK